MTEQRPDERVELPHPLKDKAQWDAYLIEQGRKQITPREWQQMADRNADRAVQLEQERDAALARAERAEADNARLRETLDAIGQASLNLYARVALGITANRMRGNDDAADNDEREYLAPWDLAWEQAKAALTAPGHDEGTGDA